MLVIIDESGDTGFKETSSAYFVLSMVVFENANENGRYIHAERTATAINQLKSILGYKSEFHFSKCSHKSRYEFFHHLNKENCEFKVFSVVVDKKSIQSAHLRGHTKKFYNFMVKQLLMHNPVHRAIVKIDGEKSKSFSQALSVYLRQSRDGMIQKIKFANSKNDSLIQLADMCCGAVAYSFSRKGKKEADTYVRILGRRITDVWEFK